jgi:uncharacterized OsmC-like protein
VRSSRQIERRCVEDLAFRVLAGNQAPDHVTIARFRVRHEHALAGLAVPVEGIEVTVEGDLDLRGTLGVAKDVPAGFQAIRVAFNVQAPKASAEQLALLAEKTERYCTVFQTLVQPPPIRTEWQTP